MRRSVGSAPLGRQIFTADAPARSSRSINQICKNSSIFSDIADPDLAMTRWNAICSCSLKSDRNRPTSFTPIGRKAAPHEHSDTDTRTPDSCHWDRLGSRRGGTEYPCHADVRIFRCGLSNFRALFRILDICAGKSRPDSFFNLVVHQEGTHCDQTDERTGSRRECTCRFTGSNVSLLTSAQQRA